LTRLVGSSVDYSQLMGAASSFTGYTGLELVPTSSIKLAEADTGTNLVCATDFDPEVAKSSERWASQIIDQNFAPSNSLFQRWSASSSD